MADVFTEERNKNIGTNIRTYRQLNGLTQDELASGICSVSQLSKIENGQTYAQRSILKNLAERLGVSVKKLESEDGLREELMESLQYAKHALTIQKYEQSLEIVHKVISKCNESLYQDELLDAQILKVELLRHMKDYKGSVEVANSVLESTTIINRTKLIQLLCQQGHSHYEYGNISVALDCYNRAHDEIEAVEIDDEIKLRLFYDLAMVNGLKKNHRTALRFADKAHKLAQEQSKNLFYLRTMYIQAIETKCLGDFEKAENLYLRALEIANSNSWVLDKGIISNNLGCLYRDKMELAEAMKLFQRAIKLFEILREDKRTLDTQLQVAEVEFELKNYKKSIEIVDMVLGVSDKIEENMFLVQAKAYKLLAMNKMIEGDFEGYVMHLEKSLQLYTENQLFIDAYEIAYELGAELDKREDARALMYFRKALEYNESSINVGLRG